MGNTFRGEFAEALQPVVLKMVGNPFVSVVHWICTLHEREVLNLEPAA